MAVGRATTIALALLAASGCHQQPAKPEETRPDWSRFRIDGIAPLMTPAAVGRALAAHGYRASDCGVGEPINPYALERATDSFCYDDPARGWRASLYFLPLIEGRRLAVVSFSDLDGAAMDEPVLQARDAAFRRKLMQRFGRPFLTQTSFRITSRVWTVPGGSASLPDNLSNSDARLTGRNVEMTSFWAYGQQRPEPSPRATP